MIFFLETKPSKFQWVILRTPYIQQQQKSICRFISNISNWLCCVLGPKSKEHPNMVRISVTIPHNDGLLPVVSTYQPSNFDYILTPSSLRVAQHQCSNLLDATEHLGGFTSNATRHRNSIGDAEPYQHDAVLRSAPTLRFYR